MNAHRERIQALASKSALRWAGAALLPLLLASPAGAESWNERGYVRASLGYEKSASADLSDAHCSSTQ
jgi:regulator of sirC expression with transglutaminase-like and TPR domain